MAETPVAPRPRQPAPQSGTLTAGSFDDNLSPDVFRRFVSKMSQSHKVPGLSAKLSGQRLIVTVKGGGRQPRRQRPRAHRQRPGPARGGPRHT